MKLLQPGERARNSGSTWAVRRVASRPRLLPQRWQSDIGVGTFKTPMVEWLARWFRKRGVRLSIVSRGYGAEEGGPQRRGHGVGAEVARRPRICPNADEYGIALAERRIAQATVIASTGRLQTPRIAALWLSCSIDAVEPLAWGSVFPRGMVARAPFWLRRVR